MTAPVCPSCGGDLPPGRTLCPHCGADTTTWVGRRSRADLRGFLIGSGWRVLVYGGIAALIVLGFLRFRTVGPGPDLATTLHWIALGDDGRHTTLVTLHRAHEIAVAAARLAIKEMEPPNLDEGWAERLEPYATLNVRGWIPLLTIGASTDTAPAAVREMYEVRARDAWGTPYRISSRELPRDPEWAGDPEVAADLENGLQRNLLAAGAPDFAERDWLRLEIVSAGPDGVFDSDDDLALVSYLPTGMTLRLDQPGAEIDRRLSEEYTLGRHYFRIEGSRWDLIDARRLAEFRLETTP